MSRVCSVISLPLLSRWGWCGLFALAMFTSPLDLVQGDTGRPPNFVVILCDNLGYGDTEPFGSTLHRTPGLNRMAREGRVFTHFYASAGVCTPSRASLMTGRYAQRMGMDVNPRDGHVLRPRSPYGLPADETTLAEALGALGYGTTIIGKWHLGDAPQFLPTRHGFDSFFGIPYSDDMTQAAGEAFVRQFGGPPWPPLPLMRDEQVIEAPVDRHELTQRYTQQALSYLEQNRDRPFFLYLAHAMPGSTPSPFASEAFRGRSRNGPWGDVVEELDASTGQILDKLVELGLAENTLVVWSSDNGAPLASDIQSASRGSNRPLYGRGYTTAEGAFRVPTIMWWPGRVPAGTRCDELASLMDLFPTFTQLAGGQPSTDRPLDGHDIRPLLFDEPGAKSPYNVFYYYQRDQLQAVRRGPWKLFLPIENATRHPHFTAGRPVEPLLFNLVDDVGSTRNVARQHPDIVQELIRTVESRAGEQ